jgi:HlyD family secretion protein
LRFTLSSGKEIMQRPFLFGSISLLVAAAGLSGCSHGNAGAQGAAGKMPPVAVDVVHAGLRDLAQYSLLDGQIAPSLSSSLALQQAGTIMAVNVREGDHVNQGQVLAQIDDRVLRAQLAQNQALLTQAGAKLSGSAQTTPINGEQVRSSLVAAKQQLAEAQNALRSAQAAYHSAQIIDDSNQKLLTQGYVARTAYEQNHATFIAAQQSLASAQATVTQDRAALLSAQRNLGQIGVQAQDVVANQGAQAQARAQVSLLETEIDQAVLRAPFDGEVTSRLLDPGAYAGPNQPILQVSAVDPVYVNFDVPDDQLQYAHRGTPVSFHLSGTNARTYTGLINAINAVPVNGTLQYRARVIQANPGNELRGGMLVSVALRKSFVHDALVVPRESVGHGMDGKANVFVISDAHAHMVPVTVGMMTDELAQISGSSVHAGDTVVRTRPDTLMDGADIKVASTGTLPASSARPPQHPTAVSTISQGAQAQ